jgi:tRNA pseudouridine38-40 synthase
MPRLLLKLAYVGTSYHGWQVQKNAKSVQGTVQAALLDVCGGDVTLTGCSRTDAGVHAKCYFALAEGNIPDSLMGKKMSVALNARLPEDICVKNVYFVGEDFHPRYSVTAKTYEYVISDSAVRDPFLKDRAWLCQRSLDADLMNKNAADFVGKHDFSAFCATGSKVQPGGDCQRHVFFANVCRKDDKVIFRVCADGFLYNMVRIMAGTLVDISFGTLKDGSISEIIASQNRKLAGRTLPAQGLYLDFVDYAEGVITEDERI